MGFAFLHTCSCCSFWCCKHAKWKEATAMHDKCFGWAFILAKKRSMLEIALKNTSEGKSYQTWNQENSQLLRKSAKPQFRFRNMKKLSKSIIRSPDSTTNSETTNTEVSRLFLTKRVVSDYKKPYQINKPDFFFTKKLF